jgi:hypothetical protein
MTTITSNGVCSPAAAIRGHQLDSLPRASHASRSIWLVLQETPGVYLDNGNPVLMSFLTGFIQLAGISGYQRIYEIQLLGQYVTPHLLQVQCGL